MLELFARQHGQLVAVEDMAAENIWVNVTNPSSEEIAEVHRKTGIVIDFLRAPLDDEERPRLDYEEGQVLVVVNIPFIPEEESLVNYDTLPLGIILTSTHFVTICLKPTAVIEDVKRAKRIHSGKKTRSLLQILFKTATQYLRYLKQIDKKSDEIERELQKSTRNKELIQLLALEKSLVYFTTSLKSNHIVMEKLLRTHLKRAPSTASETGLIQLYPEDEDLLEDVITENKQAMEMAEIYSNILSGMMDAFASVISNNVNIVMKFLTSVTIVLALPTMVASFYGMNVPLPFQHTPVAYLGIAGVSIILVIAAIVILAKRNMF